MPQNPSSSNLTLEYTQSFGFNGIAEVAKVTTDALGNVYTIGSFGRTVDLDPTSSTRLFSTEPAKVETFIRKQDANGNFLWAKQFAPKTDLADFFSVENIRYAADIDVDSAGNVYAIGDFGLNKWDSNGNSIWAKSIAESGISKLSIAQPKISVDDLGNIYAITPALGLMKFNPNGDLETKLDSDNIKTGDVSVDPSGNVYSIGAFSGVVDFDPSSGTTSLDSNNGSTFIRKTTRNQELLSIQHWQQFYPQFSPQ